MKTVIHGCLLLALTASASAHSMPHAMGNAEYGSPAAGSVFARRIDIGAASKWVNVKQDETIEMVNAAGQSFFWKFDTAKSIVPLARVAPPEFLQGRQIDAYVMRPPASD